MCVEYSIKKIKMNSDKYVISEFYAFEADSSLIKEAEEKNQPIILIGILL